MAKLLFLIFNGLLVIQLAMGQKKTAWAAANAGMGLGTTAPPDPTEHQINMAIVGINNAKTELAAAKAAATIYSPVLDMSDNVKQALENKVRTLRTPPGWAHPIPPPLPFGFDPIHLIMNAYYGTATAAPPGAAARVPAPAVGVRQPGPPTAIRRGPAPGKRQNRQRNAWQQNNNRNSGGVWDTATQHNSFQTKQPASTDRIPLASRNFGRMNRYDFTTANPWFWK